eukprot:scaffold1621_cov350-Prasinococcus_capsulatus_cf.AAC.26
MSMRRGAGQLAAFPLTAGPVRRGLDATRRMRARGGVSRRSCDTGPLYDWWPAASWVRHVEEGWPARPKAIPEPR